MILYPIFANFYLPDYNIKSVFYIIIYTMKRLKKVLSILTLVILI